MQKSVVFKSILILIISFLTYFIAKFFIDLPPYDIKINKTYMVINLDKGKASVETVIGFYNTSKFPRKNEFFLPIHVDQNQMNPENIQAMEKNAEGIEQKALFKAVGEGVIYRLNLKPGETREVKFTFSQKVKKESYICNFTRIVGLSAPVKEMTYVVSSPLNWVVHAHPPHRDEKIRNNRRYWILSVNDVKNSGIRINWNIGE